LDCIAEYFTLVQCSGKCIIQALPKSSCNETVAPPPDSKDIEIIESGHFRMAADLIKPVYNLKPSGSLLDIGCGWGHLLKLARDMGYSVVGIEQHVPLAEGAREKFGLNILEGTFPDSRLQPPFDIITISHVVEHLPDPNFMLSTAAGLLKDGGILAVASPNYNSLMRRLRGTKWKALMPWGHIWQLTGDSIASLLSKQGLEIVAKKNTTLQYNTSTGPLFRRLALKAAIGIAGPLNLGDNAIVIARKPSPGRQTDA
jgi:2-polyprenyl-3-methyl-5-hydroxy-6-metoxy-1,4-benzoquinol methylase